MLILSRKTDEEIIIGDDIVIRITDIAKGTVKIGIEAPRETIVLRGELKEKIRQVNVDAAKTQDLSALSQLSRKLQK